MFLNLHNHSLQLLREEVQEYVDRGFKVDEPVYSCGVYVATVHRQVVSAKGFKDLNRKIKTMRTNGWLVVGSPYLVAGRLTQILTKE